MKLPGSSAYRGSGFALAVLLTALHDHRVGVGSSRDHHGRIGGASSHSPVVHDILRNVFAVTSKARGVLLWVDVCTTVGVFVLGLLVHQFGLGSEFVACSGSASVSSALAVVQHRCFVINYLNSSSAV